MAYGTTAYDTCTVQFPLLPSWVELTPGTQFFYIIAIDETGRHKQFDLYSHYLSITTEEQRKKWRDSLVHVYYPYNTTSDSNVNISEYNPPAPLPFQKTKNITISNDALRSYNPKIIVAFNPKLKDLQLPYMRHTDLVFQIPMTQELITPDAVVSIDFGASSVTTEAFIKSVSNKFKNNSFDVWTNIVPYILGSATYSDYFDESYGSEGFKFELITDELVQDVDDDNNSDRSFGWRFVDGKVRLNWSMNRGKYGSEQNIDGGYIRIPCAINGTDASPLTSSYYIQNLWKYHISKYVQQIEYDYYNIKNLQDTFRQYNFSYCFRHNTNLAAGSPYQKIAEMDLVKNSYWYINGKQASGSTCFFGQGAKMQSAEQVSETEVRYRTTKILGGSYDFKLQPAGHKGNNKIYQKGTMIISNENDIMRSNKAVTI